MKLVPILSAAGLAILATAHALHAAIIPVSGAEASSVWNGTGLPLTNTINGSGITGSMATEADLGIATHDNNGSAGTMWHSQVVEAAGLTLTWNFTVPSGLRTIYYWNHNQNNLVNRGIQETEVLYSTDNGTNYQSLGSFTLEQAGGTAAERPHALDLGSTIAGVTNVRFVLVSDFGGNVTGLAEIRFSDIAPVEPKAILTLTSNEAVVLNGLPVDLTWNTERATLPTITPGLGAVAESGFQSVNPPANADTVYTLAAGSAGGPVSTSITVRSVAGGTANYRYVRFTPVKLRNGAAANSIQLSEFQLIHEGVFLTGAIAENPAGNNPAGQEPDKAVDGQPSTKWLDHNKGPLILDFGSPVTFDAYGFVTGGDAIERDPVRWILEGSNDGSAWTLIENMTTFDYPMTLTRQGYTSDIFLPGTSLTPTLVVKGDTKVVSGDPLPLTWTTVGATGVTLNDGSGPVTLGSTSGNMSVTPVANTTYIFTATNAGGKTSTASIAVTVITPAVTDIDYDNFDESGEELALLGDASVLTDATRPLPGPHDRLRLTPDQGGRIGAAWFRKRQLLSAGFETSFSFQFTTTGATSGADGMAFVVHNSADGTLAVPVETHENGLAAQALNIKFDSFQNAGEPGAASVQVLEGNIVVAIADLATLGIPLPGGLAGDLTDNSALGAPHQVRIAYMPGDLDVYVDGRLAIDSADVNLAEIEAVDTSGKAYVGFTSRTGGAFEAHDVTSWSLIVGPPAPPLVLLSSVIDRGAGQATLTWASADTRSYRITASDDLLSWDMVLAAGIPGTIGQGQTSAPVPFEEESDRLFFRVEEE